MDINQLWAFYNVAKSKSFSLAAEKLFVTQPLVSTRVKQLENAYNLKFIERSHRRIKLTNAGEILFSYADKIFSTVKEADSHMEDMKGMKFGSLRISVGLTLGTYYLPPLLAAFRNKYPNIEIQMKVTNKQQVIEDILSLSDDFGFVGYMEPNRKLITTPLWEEDLVLIVHPSHEFTKLKSLPPSRLNGQSFISRERGSGTRELVEKVLLKSKVTAKVVMELGSHEAIKRAVEAGLGISFLPVCAIERERDSGLFSIIRLNEKILLKYYMIYSKSRYLSHVMQAFIQMINHWGSKYTRERSERP